MIQITASIEEEVLTRIDSEAKLLEQTRSKWIATAVSAYLDRRPQDDLDRAKVEEEKQVLQHAQEIMLQKVGEIEIKMQEKEEQILNLKDEISWLRGQCSQIAENERLRLLMAAPPGIPEVISRTSQPRSWLDMIFNRS